MAEQLFQIGVKALVRNKSGNVLMVHVPEWKGNPAYWDLPGGRLNPGESFLDALQREMLEEIGVGYTGEPKQITTMLTPISIPVGDVRYPLVLVVYEASIADEQSVRLNPEDGEDDLAWFTPVQAAEKMTTKFSAEFCNIVRALQ